MGRIPDLRKFLNSWPYDPGNNIRRVRLASGREIIVVRQPMGVEQYETDGQPDGQRPHGMESALVFQQARLVAAARSSAEAAFRLSPTDCSELFEEGRLYCSRLVTFFHLKDWAHAERDAARNLSLIDFVKQHAALEEDQAQLEPWRPYLSRVNLIARALVCLSQGEVREALQTARDCVGPSEGSSEYLDNPRKIAAALFRQVQKCLASGPDLYSRRESVFQRQGDYWTISYQGQVAYFRSTCGLHCLACLLRRPGRECHVTELSARLAETPTTLRPGGQATGVTQAAELCPACSVLDPRAKAEYKRRIEELRWDLDEAEKYNDSERAALARAEVNLIAQQLASAVGLGGRERRTGSAAERARSAVTKRIKESIEKIGQVMPALGRHLSARIKTGYFCSYNPHPDRPVAWKF